MAPSEKKGCDSKHALSATVKSVSATAKPVLRQTSSIIVCGLPTPPSTDWFGEDMSVARVLTEHSDFFGKTVEVFIAREDTGRDPPLKLYRSAELANRVNCKANNLAMYLSRRKASDSNVWQALNFSRKGNGQKSLKIGSYFISLQACTTFAEYIARQLQPPHARPTVGTVAAAASAPFVTNNVNDSTSSNGRGKRRLQTTGAIQSSLTTATAGGAGGNHLQTNRDTLEAGPTRSGTSVQDDDRPWKRFKPKVHLKAESQNVQPLPPLTSIPTVSIPVSFPISTLTSVLPSPRLVSSVALPPPPPPVSVAPLAPVGHNQSNLVTALTTLVGASHQRAYLATLYHHAVLSHSHQVQTAAAIVAEFAAAQRTTLAQTAQTPTMQHPLLPAPVSVVETTPLTPRDVSSLATPVNAASILFYSLYWLCRELGMNTRHTRSRPSYAYAAFNH